VQTFEDHEAVPNRLDLIGLIAACIAGAQSRRRALPIEQASGLLAVISGSLRDLLKILR
jgi:hypothetical protein